MSILVTGGAGYIGSHAVRQLLGLGYQVSVLDNLSTGHAWAISSGAKFFKGDIQDKSLLKELFQKEKFTTVIHFAALTDVGESVRFPEKYNQNNFQGSCCLIDTCVEYGVQDFIFSSTAAVYGNPTHVPVDELQKPSPLNPYGTSKLAVEDYLQTKRLNWIILRYFNVAGASIDGKLGQATPRATHLVKVAAEAAVGKRPFVEVFGTDYETSDGTCIRDYIHVEDLCAAHVLVLQKLNAKKISNQIINLGYGKGYSVKEVLATMKKVSGRDFQVIYGNRRTGDSVEVVADSAKAKKLLNWQYQYNSLELICKSSFDWEMSRQKGLQS